MPQETMMLYTRQNAKTLYALEHNSRIINERIYVELHLGDVAPLFMESYDWFTAEASKMVPKPLDVKAPIWCSLSTENCLRPIDGTVVYALEVPREAVIFFSDARWDYVLNRIYLPEDSKDEAAYQKHIEALGISSRFWFFHGMNRYQYPEEIRRITDSWKRVFDVDEANLQNVSGNIWEIKKEWITKIIYPGEVLGNWKP